MEELELPIVIKYEPIKNQMTDYMIKGEYTLGEIAVIISTLKKMLYDYGYDTIRRCEDNSQL